MPKADASISLGIMPKSSVNSWEGAISEAERKIKDAKAHIARLKAARAFFEERLKDGDVFAGKRASKITRKKPAEPTFASTL